MDSNLALQQAARRRDVEDDALLGLRNGWAIVVRQRRLITAITLAVTMLGALYAAVKKPVYEGNMLIQVAPRSSGEKKNMLGEVAATFDQDTSAASEVGVIRSRAVIGPIVTALRYHIDARPKYFPLLGAGLSALHDELSAPAGGYCWGAERITVSGFEVPDAFLNKEFVVTQLGAGRFRLSDRRGSIQAEGSTDAPLALQLAGGGRLRLHISALHALPGAQFLVVRKPALTVVEDLQQALVVAETSKDSSLISVALQGTDAAAIATTLNALGSEYIRQYQQRRARSAQASQALLDSQLPGLKQRMELAEEKLNAFRDQNGTADLAEETRLQVQRLAANEQSLLDLAQKKSDLLVRFGPAHPAVTGIEKQIGLAGAGKNALAARVRRLPLLEQELGRLARDVKVSTEVYSNVLRTAQELRVISLEQAKGVRLADAPVVPRTPVNPRGTTIVLAAALGLLLGLLGAFVNQTIARTYE